MIVGVFGRLMVRVIRYTLSARWQKTDWSRESPYKNVVLRETARKSENANLSENNHIRHNALVENNFHNQFACFA